ncbi:MAG: helix-hairpin-helix domain-containing protein [Rhodothermales bacterium]
MQRPTNEAIAAALEQLADRLAEREANPHRVQAYRTAAQNIRQEEHALAERFALNGVDALKELPGIGNSLASRIGGFIQTGRLQLLERINHAFSPGTLFTRVPGIGHELAQRIHDELGIETLEDLELAAHDGRLEQVEGFGRRRVRALRDQLNTMLTRQSHRRARRFGRSASIPSDAPSVALLLSIDREYRHRSTYRELPQIAPRRFNPLGRAWLPILNTQRKPWSLTAMFSNTARAHELEKTDDWVVIYSECHGREYQYTVVTETRGALRGERVVRGREAECRTYYRKRRKRAA